MLSANTLLFISTGYVALLFLLAFFVDRRTARLGGGWLRSPLIYTLSLSVYCTAWTFYGAVGSATRNGLEFAAIYLGPTLVFVGWWWILRKLVRIGHAQSITSIADMISSRFGKSNLMAVVATIVAVVAATPYIALQLQSVALSVATIMGDGAQTNAVTGFWTAAGMALFTILFSTRSLSANERHYGVVAAIALEAVVKLVALVAVGLFAVYGVSGGVAATFEAANNESLNVDNVFSARWISLLFLSAAAIICLPRQFQVTVVENNDERHLRTASWMFPAYLLLISLFVLPIAAAGVATLPPGANPDMYVLTVPLAAGREDLAILAFIGGFSSATSMVIVSTIALSTMVSNHVVAPIAVVAMNRLANATTSDMRQVLLTSRRVSIIGILTLGYLYFRLSSGSDALASIGLVAFTGVAQFLPALLAGLFWRGATRAGALVGLSAGFLMWVYTLFLPSLGNEFFMSATTLANGPFDIAWLRPQQLFGVSGPDSLVHALVWSLGANTLLLVVVSLLTSRSPLEELQSTLFVDVFRLEPGETHRLIQRSATSEDLYVLAQRILGTDQAHQLFTRAARSQGRQGTLPEPTPAFISQLERELAGSVGAASAHAMVNRTAGGETISMQELMQIADETAQLMRTSTELASKSLELEEVANQLREANDQLRTLDMQKDEFLSQVSHELRTPMTSIRSLSEILLSDEDLAEEKRKRFASVIQDESKRLTRLLDELLDMSFLEKGEVDWRMTEVDVEQVLDSTIKIALVPHEGRQVDLRIGDRAGRVKVLADADRLAQVFLNVIANAVRHNHAEDPWIQVSSAVVGNNYEVVIEDNGAGISPELRPRLFEKFARGGGGQGFGLGLAISRQIMDRLGGKLEALPEQQHGARFKISLPITE